MCACKQGTCPGNCPCGCRHTPQPERLCSIHGCDAPLYLDISSCIPIYRINPPWPGAGEATYEPDEAVTSGWEVVCTEGHTVWTHVDQIAADNAAGLTEDDLTGDYAPTFRYDAMPQEGS